MKVQIIIKKRMNRSYQDFTYSSLGGSIRSAIIHFYTEACSWTSSLVSEKERFNKVFVIYERPVVHLPGYGITFRTRFGSFLQ